jgi:hypothetical protein
VWMDDDELVADGDGDQAGPSAAFAFEGQPAGQDRIRGCRDVAVDEFVRGVEVQGPRCDNTGNWFVGRRNSVVRTPRIWGCRDTTLSKWMNSSRVDSGKERELSVSERQELEQLRTEKREWVLEREILKKRRRSG